MQGLILLLLCAAFYIKNRKGNKAEVLVNGKPIKDIKIGVNHEPDGDDLVFFLFHEKNENVDITIKPLCIFNNLNYKSLERNTFS